MPLIAFILLAVVCLALFGFACACLSDQPAKAIDRATAIGSGLPPVISVWMFLVAFALPTLLVTRRTHHFGRASPALTQRFLF
jgi:hypothetical protein